MAKRNKKNSKPEEVITPVEEVTTETNVVQEVAPEEVEIINPEENADETVDLEGNPDAPVNVEEESNELLPPTPVNKPESKLGDMLAKYKEMAHAVCITKPQRIKMVKHLSRIVLYVVNNPSSANLNELFKFFSIHYSSLMAPEVVFAGINAHSTSGAPVLAPSDRLKLETFYGAFSLTIRNLRSKRSVGINLDVVREHLGSEEIVAFLSAKNS